MPAGSAAEREWEAKLRRAKDGIQRTTARLDLLEEYNPELATDDRVSCRASVARSDSELERSGRVVEDRQGAGRDSGYWHADDSVAGCDTNPGTD